MTPLHLGPLHPVEQWLTLGLAFGPFLVLGVVIWWRARQDAEEAPETGGAGNADSPGNADRTGDAATAGDAAAAEEPERLS
ncbi:hypothetical protein [Nocardioides sp. SYSU D00065]|uniref:hypothetical protein n=1 Tax=Nocardioides sp. SYSU D00065 TaxID=2817378 RepID=UPI001B33075D|nr:hypothetical protein [Nocardioides sp. SYSU D00065]